MADERVLRIVRGVISMKRLRKKDVAKSVGPTAPQFSEFLSGDRNIPFETYERLVRELNIAGTLIALNSRTSSAT
jgi:hypothetical protein